MKTQIPAKSRAWRETSLNAVSHNAAVLRRALNPGCRLMAVVKADAYGHGAVKISRLLEKQGVDAFAVACLSEGVDLRRHGVRGSILILGYTPPEQAELISRWNLTQTVVDETHALALSAQGSQLDVHLALDTGMHRLGIPEQDRQAIGRVYRLPNLNVRGVFSHLCVSDGRTPEAIAYTRQQLFRFYDAVDWMRQSGYEPGAVHIQASYGILNLPAQPCSYARAGIALYGVCSDTQRPAYPLYLHPVLSLRSRIVSLRVLSAGEAAGYGLAFRAIRRTRLAAVSIGYADGLPRELSQRGGQALVHGRLCPMVGRMCMDQLLLDVTDVPMASAGDIVTVIGRDGEGIIRAEDVADKCGTITNELLSRMGMRLPIVYC